MTRRKILMDLRERRFRGQRARVGDEFWGYTLTREDVDIVNGKGSLPMEEETEKQPEEVKRNHHPMQYEPVEFATLRDQFAMAALHTLGGFLVIDGATDQRVADQAYRVADAMLAVRKK